MYKLFQDEGLKLSENEHIERVKAFFNYAYIIWNANQRVGLIKYTENDEEIKIIQFQILPEFQRNGIGQKIIESIYSKNKNLRKSIKLKVLKNSPAVKFYKNLGFKIYDNDKFEYHMQLS